MVQGYFFYHLMNRILARCFDVGPMRFAVQSEHAALPLRSLIVMPDFISASEEEEICKHVYPLLKFRYQGTHWDDVIVKYREIELAVEEHAVWQRVTERMKEAIMEHQGQPDMQFLAPHVVDLAKDGHIGAHVDSIKFSGGIVAGLSLLSHRIMRLERDEEAEMHLRTQSPQHPSLHATPDALSAVEFDLPPRSLYIMAGPLRYFFSHQVLGQGSPSDLPVLLKGSTGQGMAESKSEGGGEAYKRRISLVLRDVFV